MNSLINCMIYTIEIIMNRSVYLIKRVSHKLKDDFTNLNGFGMEKLNVMELLENQHIIKVEKELFIHAN